MTRIIIVHAWGAHPADHWYPWLKKELLAKGFEVQIPQMPNTDTPTIDIWIDALDKTIGTIDNQTLLIGHSIGCQTILRYLDAKKASCAGMIFVAGWFTLTNLETKDEEKIAEPWITAPLAGDYAKKTQSILFLSTNDPYVPLENKTVFEKKIGSMTIVEKDKGHFTSDDGITQMPEILQAIDKLLPPQPKN